MDIYLIRHGECCNVSIAFFDTEKNTMDPPLTEKGMRQAAKLADRCKGIGFDRIVSSDLSRARQTAEQLKIASSCDLSIDPSFREIDMGDIHTKPWEDYPELYAKWRLHLEDLPYPNGENGEDVWNRCRIQLARLLETQYKKIAIVCHGGTIRSILCGVLGIPQHKRFYLGFPLENCSITMIRYGESEKKFYLHTLNDFLHLHDL
ncbi:MAG: histidine phosphatase family protein [Clostridiales bacterium]|nr:histidine phosphatase family protein [Clostridiales bacterium]